MSQEQLPSAEEVSRTLADILGGPEFQAFEGGLRSRLLAEVWVRLWEWFRGMFPGISESQAELLTAIIAVICLGAIAFVKADLGLISDVAMPGLELDLALLAGLVSLTLTGPGWLGADAALGTEAPAAEPVTQPSMA